jgi:dolichol-phosphate mannosyltransferase
MDYSQGEAVVIMDGDLQDPPELIPTLLEKWNEGFEVVYAIRKKRKGEKLFKLFTAYFFYRIIRKITKIQIPSDTGDFRLMSRKAMNELLKMRERHRLIRGMVSWVGYKQTGVEYERDERFAGKTKFSWFKMAQFALDGITSFSNVPLKMATYLGFLVSFLSLIKIIELSVNYFYKSYVPGWASIMVAVLFLGGVQLITIGIIGEYIGRIHEEVKNRPLYLVDEEINFKKNLVP